MNRYENTDEYKTAFNLAIKIYRLNIVLPLNILTRYGNRLRRTSLKIKDLITESYTSGRSRQALKEAMAACDEALYLLKKIGETHFRAKTTGELIRGCIVLKGMLAERLEELPQDGEKEEISLSLPF